MIFDLAKYFEYNFYLDDFSFSNENYFCFYMQIKNIASINKKTLKKEIDKNKDKLKDKYELDVKSYLGQDILSFTSYVPLREAFNDFGMEINPKFLFSIKENNNQKIICNKNEIAKLNEKNKRMEKEISNFEKFTKDIPWEFL